MGVRQIKLVIIITRADDLGGAQSHVRDLAPALASEGFDVVVIGGLGGALFDHLEAQGVSCRKLEHLVHPIKPATDWRALGEIRAVLRELKPDLVATHSNKAGLLGRFAAHSLRIPAVHTSHGFLFSGEKLNISGHFYRLIEKAAARFSSAVIAVSGSEFNKAVNLKVIPREKLVVVHNGIPDSAEQALAKPELEPARLVMVARFAEPKDHETLLQALGQLKDLPWSMQLVGDGVKKAVAEELAVNLGIAERVEFAGVREDVGALLAGSSLFILSSRREGFPISILEAMRAGLPVVASDCGGISEAVAEGETGLLFSPGNFEALKVCLEKLITNPQLRRKMGRAGRERYLQAFTLEQMVDKTAAVYKKVTAKNN
jgi:glycosyltransferase involved in cell wall biosynthesis